MVPSTGKGDKIMKRLLKGIALFLLCSYAGSQAQWSAPSAVRGQFGTVTAAMVNAVPNFVLPAVYNNRTMHPLPKTVNHETDAVAKPYMPSTGWCIDGWSCANGSAVSFNYDYAVQTYKKITSSGQYPLFTYNYTYHFIDNANQAEGGDGWMYIEAFNILKATGGITTTDFGGFGEDGNPGAVDNYQEWANGYAKYYSAMQLRVDQWYKIDAGTASGDTLMKQIVYDYADSSPAGAILSFQANSEKMPTTTVNGRKTFTSLGGDGGHCLTICGYDDTHDGGSWLIQSGWGDGDYWCPYTLLHSGGAWYGQGDNCQYNKYAAFCRIRKNYTPRFTFKINMSHSQRNQICIMTGAAGSTTATQPSKSMDYGCAFNYAGGSAPMCGTGQSATIEIGLDLTDFDSVVAAGQGTFFLRIISKGGTGTVTRLALEDYSSGSTPKEIVCSQANVAITGTIQMSIPWTGSATGAAVSNDRAARKSSGLAAVYNSGLRTFQFSFPSANARPAILQISDAGGRAVASRACVASSRTTATASWDAKDYLGRDVSSGAYVATVAVTNADGSVRRLATRILVRN
jgi:hypothetical protein